MAAFINNDITTAGLIVLAKGVAGQKINYTKIVLGDGYLEEGQTPRTLTGVVSPKATVDITKLKINGDGTVAVGGIFTNGDETEGFYYRELGLYAEDPDPEVGEVLYCYGNWVNYGAVTLFGKNGIPAAPFRTEASPLPLTAVCE